MFHRVTRLSRALAVIAMTEAGAANALWRLPAAGSVKSHV